MWFFWCLSSQSQSLRTLFLLKKSLNFTVFIFTGYIHIQYGVISIILDLYKIILYYIDSLHSSVDGTFSYGWQAAVTSLTLLSVFAAVTSGQILRCPGCKVMGYIAEDDDNLFLITNKQRMAQSPSYVNVPSTYVDIDKVYINAAPKLPYQRVELAVSSRPNRQYRTYRLPSLTSRRRLSNVLSLNSRTRLGY